MDPHLANHFVAGETVRQVTNVYTVEGKVVFIFKLFPQVAQFL